ncbi:hypothetical protein [Amycolatopsis sp. La24]|uniref:hypothetical protein n=1 Tax=Amycolatopsis sp. La24 TaxID=3028304 RepID=UPI0023AEA7CD|nr:hypothetical protein [Amycolatopsis sp. La24]
MMDRLFVPAALAGVLATMPPVSAVAQDRAHWLDAACEAMRSQFPGPHGLEAMRLARAFRAARAEVADELASAA